MVLFNLHHILRCSISVTLLFLPLSAVAGLLVVTSAKSSTPTLSKIQVRDLFLGRVASFPDGSSASPIDQSESNPLRDEFYSKVTNMSAAQAKAHWAKLYFTGRGVPPREGTGSEDVKKLINSTPGAIGYIDKSSLDSSVRVIFDAQ